MSRPTERIEITPNWSGWPRLPRDRWLASTNSMIIVINNNPERARHGLKNLRNRGSCDVVIRALDQSGRLIIGGDLTLVAGGLPIPFYRPPYGAYYILAFTANFLLSRSDLSCRAAFEYDQEPLFDYIR